MFKSSDVEVKKIMVGTGSSAVEAEKLMVGTGSSEVTAWSSTLKLTGTTDNVSRDQLRNALADRGLDYATVEEIPFQIDASASTNLRSLFYGMAELKSIPSIDTSNATSIMGFAEGCTSLTTVPTLNLASCTNISYAFSGCLALTALSLYNMGNVTNTYRSVRGCESLKQLTFFGLTREVSVDETAMTASDANAFMTALGTASGSPSITLPPSAVGCNPTKAENKGWLVDHLPGSVFDYTTAGEYTVSPPAWAEAIDIYEIGGGGGGANADYTSNGAGGNAAVPRLVSTQILTPSTGRELVRPIEVTVGAGGAIPSSTSTSGSNSYGGNGRNSFVGLWKEISTGDPYGYRADGGAGATTKGNATGQASDTITGYSGTFLGASSAPVQTTGNAPGGGGGGGSSGYNSSNRRGRAGGQGRVWLRFRGNG